MLWYVTEPIDKERQRLDLSLGLRNSVWFYNNAACPGIGSVFHPRLYTQSILGIYIAKELQLSPTLVANAIEALSMKLTYNSIKDKSEFNYKGVRAFGRDQDYLTYNYLKQASNYVTITYRQNTSRYLTSTFGTGLVKSGSRFSNYELSDSSLSILSGLNKGGRKHRDLLYQWVKDGNSDLKAWTWLTMNTLQDVEKGIYSEIHHSELPQNSFFFNFKNLKRNIYKHLKNHNDPSTIIEFLQEDEKTIYILSLKFLEIKALLDIEIRKAGLALEDYLYKSIKIESLTIESMSNIKDKIKDFNSVHSQLDLTAHQRGFISESELLFSQLLNAPNTVDFLTILLERATDFFVLGPRGYYKRALTFTIENFNGPLEYNEIAFPYSVKNLAYQLEVLE